ncbi:hypothetical protein [Mesorhizobium sp.]|nr:hypothetical protein [Mesorhizobium sp.]
MTIEMEGKSYVAVGSKVIPAEDALIGGGDFWVLFKRETTPA